MMCYFKIANSAKIVEDLRWDMHVTDDTRVRDHMTYRVTNEVESTREFNKSHLNSNSRKALSSIDSKIGGMVKRLVLIVKITKKRQKIKFQAAKQ